MAETSPRFTNRSQDSVPFWRDGRVLGVIAQIAFVIIFITGATWIINNVAQNLVTLGESQFLCRDGTSSFRCAFDFLRLDAQFDIAESVIAYDPSNAYSRALLVGVLNTIKVGFFGIILATTLGTFTGIARLSSNWLISNVAKWYVDIMRNTPLLLQLFFIFFGVILAFPAIQDAIQPFGLPIYFSQRGINLPWFEFMPSWSIWLAFLVLGVVLGLVLWIALSRREERTGQESNRWLWFFGAFLLVAIVGWFVSSAGAANNQAIMAPASLRVREFADLNTLIVGRLPVNELADLDAALEDGRLTQEEITAASLKICTVRDDPAEVNLTAQLRRDGIPYTVARSNRLDQATEAYVAGECEVFVASKSTLAGQRAVLPEPDASAIVPVAETPLRLSLPQIEGLNFVGGIKLSPNFAAILLGLVLYTGAFIAEIVRAGIQSVPKGQSEAARALGLSESQRLRLVVLPQALRVIIPPLTSQYLNLVKNSSLAIAVGYPDLWSVAFTTLNQSGRAIQVFLFVMAMYLSFSLFISFLLNWYNRRIALVER